MHAQARLQSVTELPPDDVDTLRRQMAELIAASGKCTERAYAAGFAAGRASVSGREAPRHRRRGTGHRPFWPRLVE